MKYFALFFLFIVFGAEAAHILSARLDSDQKNLLIDVAYSGGCKKHIFKLKMDGMCLETYPVQCAAELKEEIEDGEDYCQGIIRHQAVFSLRKHKLHDEYYRGAKLTIYNRKSSFSLKLP
ncbi:hypothetical protein ACJVC5_17350 [Peredibacter sp. HCB2-198]|uniref:hypothetical protein n=1 Tax=Peredibacter sp. HCB2-198 TaxID=3383025 RepID=UPI0038B63776